MSGTAAHIVRLYVSVPPSHPPSRNSLSKNSARIAARFGSNGSGGVMGSIDVEAVGSHVGRAEQFDVAIREHEVAPIEVPPRIMPRDKVRLQRDVDLVVDGSKGAS